MCRRFDCRLAVVSASCQLRAGFDRELVKSDYTLTSERLPQLILGYVQQSGFGDLNKEEGVRERREI